MPVLGQDGTVDYFVGLQVDLVEQPNSILDKMKGNRYCIKKKGDLSLIIHYLDGTYLINYHHQSLYNTILPSQGIESKTNISNCILIKRILLENNPMVDSIVDEYFRELPSTSNSNTNNNQLDIINLLDSTQIDFENLSTSEQQIQKEWNKVLLDQSSDFIHVLSLKGLFLYVSNSSLDMLEYKPEELIGNSLSSICHPSDIIPVMREIKEATTNLDKVINLLFRIRRKSSGYIWIDCRGKLHMDQSKGRKCLILSGRERPVYKLLNTGISINNDSDQEYWGKLSLAGLYLYVTPTCKNVIGFTADSLEYESIYQYLENTCVTDITRALELVKEGEISKVRHTILNSKGTYVPVQSTFYPGDTLHRIGQPSFVLLQVNLLNNINSSCSSPSTTTTQFNLFSELETFRSTNWQYELHQLRQSNKKLREQLERYSHPNNQRKKVCVVVVFSFFKKKPKLAFNRSVSNYPQVQKCVPNVNVKTLLNGAKVQTVQKSYVMLVG